MPRNPEIKSVLVIGSGPIVIGHLVSLIILEHKLVVFYEVKEFESFSLTPIQPQS